MVTRIRPILPTAVSVALALFLQGMGVARRPALANGTLANRCELRHGLCPGAGLAGLDRGGSLRPGREGAPAGGERNQGTPPVAC